MKKNRGLFGVLFTVLAAAMLLPAILGRLTVPYANNEAMSDTLGLRITWKAYSGRGEAISHIIDAYNKTENPKMKAAVLDGNEDTGEIEQLLAGKKNTVYVLPYRLVRYFGMKGSLMDLSSFFSDAQELFFPQVWALGTYDNSVYGIPWLGHSMALIYNKSLLDKGRVDAGSITSLQALVKAMEKVESQTEARGIGLVGRDGNDISWMVNQFLYSFGASLVSGDGKTVTLNSRQAREALVFYRDVLGSHAQKSWLKDTGVEVMKHFLEQEVAFEFQGIWGVTDISKNGSPFEVGVIAPEDFGMYSEVGPLMLALPANMDEKAREEAFRLIRYLISYSAQEMIMKGEYSPEHDTYYPFRTPIRVDMADSKLFQSHPEYLAFIKGFEYPSIDVPVPLWQEVKDQLYGTGLSRVMRGEMSVGEFLAMVEAKGNEIFNRSPDR